MKVNTTYIRISRGIPATCWLRVGVCFVWLSGRRRLCVCPLFAIEMFLPSRKHGRRMKTLSFAALISVSNSSALEHFRRGLYRHHGRSGEEKGKRGTYIQTPIPTSGKERRTFPPFLPTHRPAIRPYEYFQGVSSVAPGVCATLRNRPAGTRSKTATIPLLYVFWYFSRYSVTQICLNVDVKADKLKKQAWSILNTVQVSIKRL